MPVRDSRIAAVLLAAVSLTACVRRGGRNADCRWIEQSSQSRSAAHLRADTEFAEELAIEHMDAYFGPRPTKTQPAQNANEVLNTCLSSLVIQIAKSHNTSPYEVAKYFGRRSLAVDAAMYIPFLVLYILLAAMFAGFLLRRYPPEHGWTVILLIGVLASLVAAIAGAMTGETWAATMESVRVGNGHLSYRMDRLPWVRHRIEFFEVCLALFWIAAVTRYRMSRRST
jgi:hypothetical protein